MSFEDYKSYRTPKRRLAKRRPAVADFRGKWGLPVDNPTAPSGLFGAALGVRQGQRLGKRAELAPGAPPKKIARKETMRD